jgi:hypothetical protein
VEDEDWKMDGECGMASKKICKLNQVVWWGFKGAGSHESGSFFLLIAGDKASILRPWLDGNYSYKCIIKV